MAVSGSQSGKAVYFKRQKLERLYAQLELEQQSFRSQWRDLSDYVLPTRSRFFVTGTNKGDRKNNKIIDSTATMSSRTMRAGMMSGITSPARPWFRLSDSDPRISDMLSVKQWLHTVTTRMTTVFLRSNLYNVLPTGYGDLGTFGTAAILMEEDMDNVVRFYPFPVGSYKIGNDEKLRVRVFARDLRMTVRQIVDKFGRSSDKPTEIDWTNISTKVKSLWDTDNKESWVDVRHVIAPNEDYDPKKLESKYKKFMSVYYEVGFSGQQKQGAYFNAGIEDKFLREKGYDYFPVLCPRWEVTGEDVYGTYCPGMIAIGDIKQLQTGEKRSLQAVEKMINPPMIGPTSLKTQKASILPGDITYIDQREGMQGFRPAHEIRFDINSLEAKQQQVRERISKAFYEDLFLMLANSDRRQITATEVEERHQEKLLALGPVLEQLNQDLLDPLIDNTFYLMQQQNLIPPPPKELEGRELKVEYISIMAQAQKLVGLGGIERFVNFSGGIAQMAPGVLDKIDGQELIDIYGDLTSIPPGIIRTNEAVAEIRQQRAQAEQQAQQAQQMKENAETVKKLSETDVSGDNALTAMAGAMQGGQ